MFSFNIVLGCNNTFRISLTIRVNYFVFSKGYYFIITMLFCITYKILDFKVYKPANQSTNSNASQCFYF